ncbi:Uncharacterized protein APZ42_028818 [Daphnia magna]|uniref:Retrotransposon gag domain-containing protein n=1 Tax=Daphnia magna TaxID=35525 RepID=A0A164Q5N7_9CRUS|nr:Uncharacterized protein APZ42_028818 [Daphnia magna]
MYYIMVAALFNSTTMNDDVITGRSRNERTPIQPIVPQINVSLPSEPTVARSLNLNCTTPEMISEPASKPASPIGIQQITRDNFQLKRPREDLPAQDESDSVSNPCSKEPEGTRSGLPVDRSEDLGTADLVDSGHPSNEPVPARPESNEGRDATERRDDFGFLSALWDFHQTQRRTLFSSNERAETVTLPLSSTAAGLPTDVPYRHLQPNFISTGATSTDSFGAASSRDQLVAEEIGQLHGSNQPEQRADCRGDQTKALLNQCPFAGESCSTSKTGAIRRPPPYSAFPSSTLDPTHSYTDSTTQECSRRYIESRSSTTSSSTQFHNSRQESLKAQKTNPDNMAQCPSPSRAAMARDLDDFQNNQHTFSRWNYFLRLPELTDRAFFVIQAILKDYPHDYDSVKEALLNNFHGDENVDVHLKKFNKAKRKPGEKIVDYALRLQAIFKRVYSACHFEKSFAIILIQKFIEGLDYRLEALEADREKQEFIRSIDGSHDANNLESQKQQNERDKSFGRQTRQDYNRKNQFKEKLARFYFEEQEPLRKTSRTPKLGTRTRKSNDISRKPSETIYKKLQVKFIETKNSNDSRLDEDESREITKRVGDISELTLPTDSGDKSIHYELEIEQTNDFEPTIENLKTQIEYLNKTIIYLEKENKQLKRSSTWA